MGEAGKAKMGQCLGGGLLSLSLSLLALLARLCVQLKGLFYSFCRNFILSCRKFFLFFHSFVLSYRIFSFHRSFFSSFCSCFSFCHSFNSSFCLQKAFFRALCFFEIFKRFICALLHPFCHFECSEKSTQIKRKLAIFGYFANAQYDKISDTKSVWYGKTNRYDKFRLSPKFFKTKEKFEKFKEFANFFKKNLLEV